MIRSHGLRHIQIEVRDSERALSFYQRLLGMEEQFRHESGIFASVPGGGDMITFAQSPEFRPGEQRGLRHFGFAVDPDFDVDAAVREIEAAGGKVVRTGSRGPQEPYIYFEDLDGYEVELSPV